MTRRFLPELPRLMVDEAVKAALLEDWGRAGDITSQATLPPDAKASAVIAARKPGVLAGLAFAESAFRQTDAGLHFEADLEMVTGCRPRQLSPGSRGQPARFSLPKGWH